MECGRIGESYRIDTFSFLINSVATVQFPVQPVQIGYANVVGAGIGKAAARRNIVYLCKDKWFG